MKKISIGLIVLGIILVIAGGIFFHKEPNAADSKPLTVTLAGNKIFRWPTVSGVALMLVGAIFYTSTFKSRKVQH